MVKLLKHYDNCLFRSSHAICVIAILSVRVGTSDKAVIMLALPAQFDLMENQGYLIIAVYLHYFNPGSLKVRTDVHFLSAEEFEGTIHEAQLSSRRWLQPGESPYPGYCRAPGSGVCLPVLCNCEKLKEIWHRIQKNKKIKNMS